MAKVSKRYNAAKEMIDRSKVYTVEEAVDLAKKASSAKFDETVEVSFNLNVDPRHADQQIRGAMVLPNGTGKSQTVAVVAEGDKAKEAEEAGADYVGSDELIQKIQGGWFEFDVLIATPNMMGKLGRLGRVLGPKGLMPNPKTGTVTDKIGNAVAEAKAGRVEFRADKGACVQVPVGKLSFTAEDLAENCGAVIQALVKAKPASAKGVYIQTCTISSTMSPGIKVDVRDYMKEQK